MKLYIHHYCSISPAGVWVNDVDGQQLSALQGARAYAVEPDYAPLIPPMQLRRMSKPIRLGMAAARLCLQEERQLNSIHVGTAYGNLADSEQFLQKMIVQEEQLLNPTAFIQSTHNTVSGQIALALGCNAHNMTFVHRGHSLESAFVDAGLQLPAASEAYALVGAVDECTDIAYEILNDCGAFPPGSAAGEGATFFQVSTGNQGPYKAVLNGFSMFRASRIEEVITAVDTFIQQQVAGSIDPADLVLYGSDSEERYGDLCTRFFAGNRRIPFKDYCGIFPSSIGFGICLGVGLLPGHGHCWILNNEGDYWSIWHLSR